MDDLISRQALLDKFEPWLKVKDYNDGELNMLKAILYEIRFAPELSTNMAEVGTDVPDKNVGELISRQSAVDELVKMLSDCFYADEEVLDAVETTLKELPSVTPKQRTGKWIKTARWRNVYKCDQCGNYLDFSGVNAGRGDANFCPNCGSRNEVTK